MRQSENQQDSDCECCTEQKNPKQQIFKIDFSHIFSFPLTCGSKIASDAIIRIIRIKKIQKVPDLVDSSTEPLLSCAIAINVEPSAVPHPSKFRAKCSNTTVLRSLKSIFPSQSLIALPGCGIHEDSDYGSQKVSNGLCANDSVITKACGRNQDYDGKNHALPAD